MLEFKVKPDGREEYALTATTRDVLVWEKTSKGGSFVELMQKLPLEDLYKIAHIASKRQGQFTGTLREFEEGVELEFGELEESPDPTKPAA